MNLKLIENLNKLELKNEFTKNFIKTQNEKFQSYLSNNQYKQKFKNNIRNNFNYYKFSCPILLNDNHYYYFENTGLESFSKLMKSKDLSKSETFFNPNYLSKDKTLSLNTLNFSKSAKYLGYSLSKSGSDWSTIFVRSTDKPFNDESKDHNNDVDRLNESIKFVKFSNIGWLKDDGFFYQRYDTNVNEEYENDNFEGLETEKNEYAKLYYHKVGTPQSEDILVFENKDEPNHMWSASCSDDGRYLYLTISRDTSRKNLLYIADLANPSNNKISSQMEWIKVVNDWKYEYDVINNVNDKIYIITNENANNYKILTLDLSNPSQPKFETLVENDNNAFLSDANIINDDRLALIYSKDVNDQLFIHNLKTGERQFRLFENYIGTINQFSGKKHHKQFYISMTNFTTPGTILKFDFDQYEKTKNLNESSSVFRSTSVSNLSPDEFITEQVFYESKDGTKIPMFITRHIDTQMDGTSSALQYAYGGFSISVKPFFSPAALTFVKHFKSMLVVTNIRGGSEYGESWHLDGTKERKQNCFDDFLYGSKYLIDHKYVKAGKIIANGGSNGGLLAAVVANQDNQNLLGASIVDVGVLDMLKFHLFTIGSAWKSDYGDPDNPDDAEYIKKYSPLHNINPNKVYPSMLLTTAAHDDRVSPLHTFKHIGELLL